MLMDEESGKRMHADPRISGSSVDKIRSWKRIAMSYLSERTCCSPWILATLILVSSLASLDTHRYWRDIEQVVEYSGYSLVALWWFLAMKHSAARIDWIIHSIMIVLMPPLASLFVRAIIRHVAEWA